jgi:hypothetical protein
MPNLTVRKNVTTIPTNLLLEYVVAALRTLTLTAMALPTVLMFVLKTLVNRPRRVSVAVEYLM